MKPVAPEAPLIPVAPVNPVEKNPNIQVWGIDTYGSVFKKYHETGIFDEKEIYSYLTEGIGEDILPKCVDFSVIDLFEKVTDKEGMLMTRRLAKEEGIFVGNSAGCAVQGLLQLKDRLTEKDVVVVIFHDHGSRYVGKIFNDDWMRDRGFLEKPKVTISDIAGNNGMEIITIDENALVAEAIAKITGNNVSQLPVFSGDKPVGSVNDGQLFSLLMKNPAAKNEKIGTVMLASFPVVGADTSVEQITAKFTKNNSAVLFKDHTGKYKIITKHDLISAIAG